MKTFKVLITLVAITVLAPAAWAGPIFLTGHDPDFHSQSGGAEGTGAGNLLRTGIQYATSGSAYTTTEKFLWVESRIATPGGHRIGELGLGTIGLSLGVHYDRANGAELGAIDFSDYTAIAIASNFGGLLTRAELDVLNGRSAEIETFVNSGGGIFAGSQCDNCGADLLGVNPDLFGFLPVDVTSIGASGPFTATAFGNSLGLVDADLNAPTHNSFGLVGGLNVVDTDSAGNATTLAGNVTIDDGGFNAVPEPATIALFGFGLVGLGMGRYRSKS